MSDRQKSEFSTFSVSILLICFIVGVVGRMLIEHFPNLVPEFTEEFNWQRSTIASIFSLCAIVNGLFGPFAGLLFDRFGPLKIFTLGFAFAGCGLIIAGHATSLWEMYIGLGVMLGLSASLCGNITNSTLVTRWFDKKLPLALSIIFSAYGAGSFFGFSVSQLLITKFGWRDAEIYLGLSILIMIVGLYLLPWKKIAAGRPLPQLKQTSSNTQSATEDISLRQAVAQPAFWGLSAIFFITANGTYGVLFHSVSFIIDHGLTPLEASFNVGLTGLLVPPGMIFCGYLLTRFNIIVVSAGTHIITALSIIALWSFDGPEHYYLIIIFIALFGLTAGTRAPIVGSLTGRIFKGRNFGVIYGSISVGGGIGVACGSFMSGWIYDITGSYDPPLAYATICMLLGALPAIIIPTLRRAGRN